MRAWFIDAIDARAGLAFASFRGADLTADAPEMESIAVHIAPPDFRAETLSSRATGLAAARGSFQAGLFVGDGEAQAEVGFADLDYLIEFVRRAYLSGGAGDGPGGVGGLPPPPEEPGLGGESPKEGPEGSEAEMTEAGWAIGNLFKTVSHTSHLAGPGGGPWEGMLLAVAITPDYEPQTGGMADSAPLLATAAAHLLAELIIRCPRLPDDEAIADWWASLRALAGAIDRLDLWEALFVEHLLPPLRHAGNRIADRLHLMFDNSEGSRAYSSNPGANGLDVVVALLGGEEAWGIDQYFTSSGHGPSFMRDQSAFCIRADDADRHQDLGAWPISDAVCHRAGLVPGYSSLSDFLCLATGAPLALTSWGGIECGLLLFAAIHLVSGTGDPLGRRWRGPLRLARRNAMAKRGRTWLVRQFPQRAFPPVIEEILQQAPRRHYA